MSTQTLSRDALVEIATAWCRQTALVEPGVFERLMTEDCLVHGLAIGGGVFRGPREVREAFEGLYRLYPRKACDVLDAIVEGDRIAVRWVMRFEPGAGDWRTDTGEIDGMTIQIVRDGRIVEMWTNFGHWWV